MLHRFKLFYVILHCFTSFYIISHCFTSFYIILHHFTWKELSFSFLLTKVEKTKIAVQSGSVLHTLYFVNQTKVNYKAKLWDLISFYMFIKAKTNHYLRQSQTVILCFHNCAFTIETSKTNKTDISVLAFD